MILYSEEVAVSELKNRNKIIVDGIRIANDMTRMQQEYFKNLKTKLLELDDNSKTIKCIGCKPIIVSVVTNNTVNPAVDASGLSGPGNSTCLRHFQINVYRGASQYFLTYRPRCIRRSSCNAV